MTHFVVDKKLEGVDRVAVEFFPVEPHDEDHRCIGHLFFERRPWRLAAAVLDAPAHYFLHDPSGPSSSANDVVRARHRPGTPRSPLDRGSSCLLPVPRHPAVRADAALMPTTAQHVRADGPLAAFHFPRSNDSRVHMHLTWEKGAPWWSRMELHHHLANGERKPALLGEYISTRSLERNVELAKLIAVDGEPVENLPIPESLLMSLLERHLPSEVGDTSSPTRTEHTERALDVDGPCAVARVPPSAPADEPVRAGSFRVRLDDGWREDAPGRNQQWWFAHHAAAVRARVDTRMDPLPIDPVHAVALQRRFAAVARGELGARTPGSTKELEALLPGRRQGARFGPPERREVVVRAIRRYGRGWGLPIAGELPDAQLRFLVLIANSETDEGVPLPALDRLVITWPSASHERDAPLAEALLESVRIEPEPRSRSCGGRVIAAMGESCHPCCADTSPWWKDQCLDLEAAAGGEERCRLEDCVHVCKPGDPDHLRWNRVRYTLTGALPKGVEAAVGSNCARPQHGFGALQRPSSPRVVPNGDRGRRGDGRRGE